ncbi:hypothetical protein FH972_021607 [Carpinus fangiana]|uniref:Uncharacterized protein n=1 Tax=Carpinus fangiana TaxID=176857 RepID=A0A5N6KQ63_9ROSI|nr:hypothetical protein FH972_021607 [Carpinus fangiana]
MARLRWPMSSRGPKYATVDNEEDRFGERSAVSAYADKPVAAPAWATRRPRWLIAGAFAFTLLFLGLFVTNNKNYHDWVPAPFRPSYVFFLVPAPAASVGLCKTLTSSAALGFPPPSLIGWEKHFEDSDGGVAPRLIANMFDHLNRLDSHMDDSLVMIVEGGSMYFQLRPDVLLSRYFDINHEANMHIHARLGPAMMKEHIQQRIVFAAQAECKEGKVYNPRCSASPASLLKPTSFPASTDANPRFLSGRAMIGPIRDVRALLRRAKLKANAAATKRVPVIPEEIYAEIFGEQEVQRELSRLKHRTWIGTLVDNWHRRTSFLNGNTEVLPTKDATIYEFGIGLDYAGSIFSHFATPTGPNHAKAFFPHAHTELLAELSHNAGLKDVIPLSSLSALSDRALLASKPPFWTPASGRNASLPPQNTSWANVALLTDLETGIAPVTLPSFTDHPPGAAPDSDGWPKSWLASAARLRPLLYARGVAPIEPLARLRLPSNAQPWDPLAPPAGSAARNAAGAGTSRAQRPLSAYEDSSLYYDSETRRPRPLHVQLAAYARTLPAVVLGGVNGGEREHVWWPAGLQREGAHTWQGGGDVGWGKLCGDDAKVWGDAGGEWQETTWWPE